MLTKIIKNEHSVYNNYVVNVLGRVAETGSILVELTTGANCGDTIIVTEKDLRTNLVVIK